jgi:Flp pilus assembly protein TadG
MKRTKLTHTMRRPGRRPLRRAGAILTMELLLVLPIVLALFFGMVEFSMLWTARGRVQEAARAGCRAATLPGASVVSVTQASQYALQKPALAQCASVSISGGQCSGDLVAVRVSVPMNAAAPDLLAIFGISLSQLSLSAETVMRKE